MNRLGKLILVATSLAPVLWACAVVEWRSESGSDSRAWAFLGVGFLFVLLCGWLIYSQRVGGERETLHTKKVKQADKEFLAFLVAYLLPFTKGAGPVSADLVIVGFVALMIGACVFYSHGFTFNPVLNMLFGYHFYEVESQSGVTHLLLTRTPILAAENELRVVRLQNYLYLDVSEPR